MTVLYCRSVADHSSVRASTLQGTGLLQTSLQLLEPDVRNLHAAEWRMIAAVLTLAMPIRAAADPKPQTLGDSRQALLHPHGVTRMPNFDAIESLVLEDANLRLGPVIPQMRGDGETTDLVHQSRDFRE